MHVLSLDQNKRFVFRLDDNHFEEFQNQLKPGEEKVVRFQLTTAQTREYRNDRNLRNEMLSTTYKIRFAKPITGVNPDGSPKYEFIATNIFPEEASLDELIDVYRDRWNAKASYDYLKNDLMIEQFSEKSFKGILRELYAAWMVFNSTASMAAVIQKTHEELVFENDNDQKIILEKLEEYIHELEVDYSAVFKKCTNDFIKMYREKNAIKRGRLLDQAMAKVEKKLLPIMLIRESLKQKVESRRSDNI
ncbi:MAG: hypothetical protein Q4A59_01955, partial [Erysipelotrichaceae bacterium]|nr:hypothetical protein [Erysipelotrichaceae bacterium]